MVEPEERLRPEPLRGSGPVAHPGNFRPIPHWHDHIPFYEYFHGDNGAGLGASHQTGWTGVVAKLIQLFGLLDAGRTLEAGKMAAFVGGKPEGEAAT